MTQATAIIDFSIPAMRLLEKLPEHVRAEVIYGKLYILSHPTLHHARLVTRISRELVNHVEDNNLGEVFSSNVGVFLVEGRNSVAPDIVYIGSSNPKQKMPLFNS